MSADPLAFLDEMSGEVMAQRIAALADPIAWNDGVWAQAQHVVPGELLQLMRQRGALASVAFVIGSAKQIAGVDDFDIATTLVALERARKRLSDELRRVEAADWRRRWLLYLGLPASPYPYLPGAARILVFTASIRRTEALLMALAQIDWIAAPRTAQAAAT